MNKRIIKDEEVSFIEIKNDKNLEVTLCTLGASFYRIVYKGKNRIMTPINHKEFYYNEQYYGKLVGRFSGRIKDAKCEKVEPEEADVKGFDEYIEKYKKGLKIERAAVDVL